MCLLPPHASSAQHSQHRPHSPEAGMQEGHQACTLQNTWSQSNERIFDLSLPHLRSGLAVEVQGHEMRAPASVLKSIWPFSGQLRAQDFSNVHQKVHIRPRIVHQLLCKRSGHKSLPFLMTFKACSWLAQGITCLRKDTVDRKTWSTCKCEQEEIMK